jgi:hypothetical protein
MIIHKSTTFIHIGAYYQSKLIIRILRQIIYKIYIIVELTILFLFTFYNDAATKLQKTNHDYNNYLYIGN